MLRLYLGHGLQPLIECHTATGNVLLRRQTWGFTALHIYSSYRSMTVLLSAGYLSESLYNSILSRLFVSFYSLLFIS